YIEKTRSSMITLGVNRFPSFHFSRNKPGTYSRLRDIEAPMLGACYLTEWTAGIEQLYDIQKEILTYNNSETLYEQIQRLRKDSTLRKHIRKQGQWRALRTHSIPETLDKLLKKLAIFTK